MSTVLKPLLLLVAGAAIGVATVLLWPDLVPGHGDLSGETAESAREPLYWVAPMDPSYRRDGPGKSPMGMDLVPVYADDAREESAGTVSISPQVVNNLGVRSTEVREAPLGSEIRTVGYVRYDEDRLVHIHPRLEGWIERLFVTASGDPVTKDQPLYDLYSPQLVAAQEELVLALRRNNAVLEQAAEDRLRALQVAPEVIETLKRDRRVRQTVTFSAPQDGVVDNLNIREGFYVGPSTTLMSIGALDEVWVEAEVFERQAGQVAVGQDVIMTLDFLPGRSWSGRVDYVYPSLDETTRTLRVRLRFPNPQRELRPNMFVQIVIVTDEGEPTLLVPRESVIRLGDRNRVVLDLGGGRYRSVPVRLGRLGSQHYEVLAGLEAGDRVVTSAQFLIDSESSRQAELQRMGDPPEKPVQTARVQGTVVDLAADRRLVTIDRDAIAKWRRPAATVTFIVDAAVDLADLPVGERIDFSFVIDTGEFVLTRVHAIVATGPEPGGTGGES
jgi:Cu(I)/Ag(I) efflux system membrane fusion protein